MLQIAKLIIKLEDVCIETHLPVSSLPCYSLPYMEPQQILLKRDNLKKNMS